MMWEFSLTLRSHTSTEALYRSEMGPKWFSGPSLGDCTCDSRVLMLPSQLDSCHKKERNLWMDCARIQWMVATTIEPAKKSGAVLPTAGTALLRVVLRVRANRWKAKDQQSLWLTVRTSTYCQTHEHRQPQAYAKLQANGLYIIWKLVSYGTSMAIQESTDFESNQKITMCYLFI